MADVEFIFRPALAGARRGTWGGSDAGAAGCRLRALGEGHVIQVLGSPQSGDISHRLATHSIAATSAVRSNGPGQWLIVGDSVLSAQAIRNAEAELAGTAALVDQSHGRIRLEVSGRASEAVLAKGTGVDLSQGAFPEGRAVQTVLGPIGAHITRTGPARFEIIVLRSFAVQAWDDLIDMAREFGVVAE